MLANWSSSCPLSSSARGSLSHGDCLGEPLTESSLAPPVRTSAMAPVPSSSLPSEGDWLERDDWSLSSSNGGVGGCSPFDPGSRGDTFGDSLADEPRLGAQRPVDFLLADDFLLAAESSSFWSVSPSCGRERSRGDPSSPSSFFSSPPLVKASAMAPEPSSSLPSSSASSSPFLLLDDFLLPDDFLLSVDFLLRADSSPSFFSSPVNALAI